MFIRLPFRKRYTLLRKVFKPEIYPEAFSAYFLKLPNDIQVNWFRDEGMIVGTVKACAKEFMTQGEDADDFIRMVNRSVITAFNIPDDGAIYFIKTKAALQNFFIFFNLYDWRPNARQLIDCTLKTHASDLDMVVRYFRRKGVKKICVAGHSYDGPTILLSKDKNFDAVALGDPSYKSSFTKAYKAVPAGKYIRILNGYFMRWGVSVVLGKNMVKEADTLPWDDLTKNFNVPLSIISAGGAFW